MENEKNETLDSTNEEVNQETENLENEETSIEETSEAQTEEKNRQLFARAKKAEKELKKTKERLEELESQPPKTVSFSEEEILKKVDERLEEKELNSLDLDEDLKKEIKVYAKLNNVSVSKAKDSEYIRFKLDKLEQKKKAEEASAGGGSHTTTTDLKNLDISKLDMWNEEDRKKFEEWKKLNS